MRHGGRIIGVLAVLSSRHAGIPCWQRIFVVIAVIWIVIGGSWGWRHAYDQVDADFKTCVAAVKTASDLESCRETRNAAIAIPRGVHAAIVAFGPLLIVWLAVYGRSSFFAG